MRIAWSEGNPDDPRLPDRSFDYVPLFDDLKNKYYACALDTPGYAFSDKTLGGYDYSIDDDTRLVDSIMAIRWRR
jgi:hypothetical protein